MKDENKLLRVKSRMKEKKLQMMIEQYRNEVNYLKATAQKHRKEYVDEYEKRINEKKRGDMFEARARSLEL